MNHKTKNAPQACGRAGGTTRRRFLGACGGIFALSIGLLSTGCGKQGQPPGSAPPTVSVIQPVEREVVEWDEYTGRLESPESVEVRARVNGYLDKVHFKEGKEVKRGDLLFTIDRRPYQAELDRVEAEHQRAESQAELAKNDAKRAKRLIATKAISEEDFDTKTRTYVSAVAAVKSAKAALNSANLNLEFTEIRSPINGRISRAEVTAGNLVSGGLGGAGATMLTTIVSQDPLYCYVDLDERSVLKYLALRKAGTRVSALDAEISVEVALANEENFPRKGRVDFVDNKVDPTTGTVMCRAVIENPDRTLGPGFFARLRLPGSGKYVAMLLPDRALGADQAQKFVYVVNAEQKVEFRPVTLGPIIDGLRVVKSGLKPEEKVIVEGLLRVRPGVAVQAQPWQASPQVVAK
jgi:RND family efflux transporter MFP subunit